MVFHDDLVLIYRLYLLELLGIVKLVITCVKYIPQVAMNYRRRSTVGWNIQNIFLDCSGATLNLAQLFLDAYRLDEWRSILGDPCKLGLGLLSLVASLLVIL